MDDSISSSGGDNTVMTIATVVSAVAAILSAIAALVVACR
jgi:hypothetical protein